MTVSETTASGRRTTFYRSNEEEPHISRRKQILEKHPEIEKLFGNEPRVAPIVVLMVISQLTIAYF